MWRRSCAAAMIVLMSMAVPAFGGVYTFEIDETKSTCSLAQSVTGMEGTFSLDLDGSSPTWAGTVALTGINAWNLGRVSVGPFNIQPGNLQLLGVNSKGTDTGTLAYAPGTHIATGTVNTDIDIKVIFESSAPLAGWRGPFPWTVEVSDDDWIGSKEKGWTPEARLSMTGEIREGGMTVPFTLRLVGAVVPEPATWMLMGLGMIGLWAVARRKRGR